jgi:hypothetical protein
MFIAIYRFYKSEVYKTKIQAPKGPICGVGCVDDECLLEIFNVRFENLYDAYDDRGRDA